MELPPEIRENIYKELLVMWHLPIGNNGVWWRFNHPEPDSSRLIRAAAPMARGNWFLMEIRMSSSGIDGVNHKIRDEIAVLLRKENDPRKRWAMIIG